MESDAVADNGAALLTDPLDSMAPPLSCSIAFAMPATAAHLKVTNADPVVAAARVASLPVEVLDLAAFSAAIVAERPALTLIYSPSPPLHRHGPVSGNADVDAPRRRHSAASIVSARHFPPLVQLPSQQKKRQPLVRDALLYFPRLLWGAATSAGHLAMVLVSVYSLPGSVAKALSYAYRRRRHAFPLMSWSQVMMSVLFGAFHEQPVQRHPNASSLLDSLPTELLLNVARRLPVESVVEFGLTARRFLAVTEDRSLWMQLVRRDFGHARRLKLCPHSRRRRRSSSSSTSDGNSRKPWSEEKWHYRILSETARLQRPCKCTHADSWRHTLVTGVMCRHHASWADLRQSPSELLQTQATRAREHLYHVPLTPVKLLGLALALVLIPPTHLRLSTIAFHGAFGHIAQDLHSASVMIVRDAVVEEGHWLVVTAPLAALAAFLRDVDWLLRKVTTHRRLLVALARCVLGVSVIGLAAIGWLTGWRLLTAAAATKGTAAAVVYL
ncbi:hypothetical protein BC828DRAFT_379151 [Blastocladiella britannica]|nr:hypothetical protein BC828DRAFT_379151 [Blastocladiella britannica]